MKKILYFPFLLLFLGACAPQSSSSSEGEHVHEPVTLTVYQVYEEVYGSGEWSSPRLDTEIEYLCHDSVHFDVDSEVMSKIRPAYYCQGDGYYWIIGFFEDEQLTRQLPMECEIMADATVYYGCRG